MGDGGDDLCKFLGGEGGWKGGEWLTEDAGWRGGFQGVCTPGHTEYMCGQAAGPPTARVLPPPSRSPCALACSAVPCSMGGSLVAGILTGSPALLGLALDSELIVEPVRGPLIPGFSAVKEAAKAAGGVCVWGGGGGGLVCLGGFGGVGIRGCKWTG